MTPTEQFLENGECGGQKKRTMRQQTARLNLIGFNLYRQGYTQPLLKCISRDQVDYVMPEIHKVVCGTHLGVRIMAAKVLRTG